MLIDWFTVAAQALNFVILVWLMKRFLYKPVLHAIDAREARVAAELADAHAKRAEAETERTELRRRNESFDQERGRLLSEAVDEAAGERQRLLDEARAAADVLAERRQDTRRREAHDLSLALTRQTREEVFAIARKVLADLAAASLEERMSEAFTRRLRDMDDQAKARLGAAMKQTSDPARVRSAFALPKPQRAAIQDALNEVFSGEISVRFETASELIGGIDLAANGQRVAWSIDGYLGALERSVTALAGGAVTPHEESKPEAVPVSTGWTHEHDA